MRLSRRYLAIDHIRNFGIIAHIDGGKSTLSERLLTESGRLRQAGSIDEGTTAMDFLELERERGITIQSACVTMNWNSHSLNLIDTPGHVDFTVEVERSLRVLDGCILVVDGTVGIQAQTETVWRQAMRHSVPRIAYINKLDRDSAVDSLPEVLNSIRRRLGVEPLPCQMITSLSPSAHIVRDLLHNDSDLQQQQQVSKRRRSKSDQGQQSQVVKTSFAWYGNDDGDLDPRQEHADIIERDENSLGARRQRLYEQLAEHDDEFAEHWLELEDAAQLSDMHVLRGAMQRATSAGSPLLPVLFGSALRSRGVRPLLNAVVELLPSPPAPVKSDPFVSASVEARALAFKVVHDDRRGLIVFLRVYDGVLRNYDSVLCTRSGKVQRITRLVRIETDRFVDLREACAGDICAAIGLSDEGQVATGDTLVVLKSPEKASADADHSHDKYSLPGVPLPRPVYGRTLEPKSAQDARKLAEALRLLCLEDPSLVARLAEDGSGEWVLSGQGELHLDVALHRLEEHYNVVVRTGEERVAYRTAPSQAVALGCDDDAREGASFAFDYRSSGRACRILVDLTLEPLSRGAGSQIVIGSQGTAIVKGDDAATRKKSRLAEKMLKKLEPIEKSLRDGVKRALLHGPFDGHSMEDCSVQVKQVRLVVGSPDADPGSLRGSHSDASLSSANSPDTANGGLVLFDTVTGELNTSAAVLSAFSSSQLVYLTAALSEATERAMLVSHPILLEPIMRVEVSLSNEGFGQDEVLSELAGRRRGIIEELPLDNSSPQSSSLTMKQIVALVPLANMLDFATVLRSLTQGNGSFSMEFSKFDEKV